MQQTGLDEDFRKIAEVMPQLVWTAAPDGTIDYFNQRWIAYTGLTVAEVTSGTFRHVVHPDDVEVMWDRWNRSIATGETFEIEYRLRRVVDGSYRWFLGRAVPVGEPGRSPRWIGTATDIDDQKRARDSLAFVVHAGSLLSASLDEQTICNELARIAIEDFSDWCFVTLTTVEGQFRTAAIAHKNPELVRYLERFRDRYPSRPDGPLAHVVATNAPILYDRITPELLSESAQDSEHLRIMQSLHIHSAMIVPISSHGTVYGAFTMATAHSGHVFDASDLEIAVTVAERAALAIQNARMFSEAERTSQRLRFTAKASQLLLESLDLGETFERIAGLIVSEIADACFIARIQGSAIRAIAASHRNPELRPLVRAFVGSRTMQPAAEVELIERLRKGSPILREHLDVRRLKKRGWPYLATGIDALQPTSAVVVPLQTRNETYGAVFAYYTDSGRSYDESDLPVLWEIATRASIAIENAETLDRERRIATTLQEASLPSIIEQPQGLHFDAVYSPAGDEGSVGGDWYDAIDLENGSVIISVGDVTGQGLKAAVIMSKVRHAMGVLPRHESDPARILDSAGWFLRKRYPDAIVTAFVGVISADRKTLHFANAGHPYPLLRRNGELTELVSHGLPMGLRSFAEPARSESIEIFDGDLLVLYTDGLIEWGRDWQAGERKLHELLQSDAIVHAVEPAKMIERTCTPQRSHDDIAILTVSVGASDGWSFKVEDARAAENARTELVDYLRKRIRDKTMIENAELAFGELIGNVVRHAPGPVEVVLDWEGAHPVLHVIDTGPEFTPTNTLPDDLSESGRGLYIVRTICRDLQVERIADYGNHVRAVIG